jgi:uncharacterized protein
MSRYPELAAKVDAFFTRVQARHGEDMKCGSGCHHCCHVRLSITHVEADAIHTEVAGWTAERKHALTANAAAAREDRCAALDSGGRCLIYAARPIVCRSHGAPIRLRNERSLPVVQACWENFTAHGPAAAEPDCIIDQTTLSALVLAIDRDAGGDGERIDLADVIAGC